MPYEKGYSRKAIGKNIGLFVKEGKTREQAAGEAYEIARDAKRKAGKNPNSGTTKRKK